MTSQALTEDGHRLDVVTHKEAAIGRRVAAERAVVQRQLVSSCTVNRRLQTQMANFRVPPTIDYIHTNDRVYKLKRKVIIWQRKLDIAKMTLLNLRAVHGISGQPAAASGSSAERSQAGGRGPTPAPLRVLSSRLVPAAAGTAR
ncbi:hypothetical protein FJT64_005756 [Amphibalanus amphitrite]|uniref:Uncharacterized protein n=1 Tax=Amphibalanus amphitrite TaxID=1232801 RepID=A0A6A4VRF2_AMPAM|nr:hypothetical protein FJT64_005756 [Amphibalanus amphitrite]